MTCYFINGCSIEQSLYNKCFESAGSSLQKSEVERRISDHATRAEFKDLLMRANSAS